MIAAALLAGAAFEVLVSLALVWLGWWPLALVTGGMAVVLWRGARWKSGVDERRAGR